MKKIIILGSNGNIGTQTLDVIRRNKDLFKVVGLSVGRDLELAKKNIDEFKPEIVCFRSKEDIILGDYKICYGDEGLIELSTYQPNNDILLINALVGIVGIKPTYEAICIKRNVALANKEVLVCAGEIIMKKAREKNVDIFPIDSEHSAIYQLLLGEPSCNVEKIIITASGGAFLNKSKEELENVSLSSALNHPNWNMGAKITIDCATMMNKGYEVIEAHHLFNVDVDHIETIIHPKSLVHSIVLFKDGVMKMHAGIADMKIPISYALFHENREELDSRLPLDGLNLEFRKMDFEKYPCLSYAYLAIKEGGFRPSIICAANDAANYLFRIGKIKFLDIEKIVKKYLYKKIDYPDFNIDNIIALTINIYNEVLLSYEV